MKLPRYTIVIVALIVLIASIYLSNNQEVNEFVNTPPIKIDSEPQDYIKAPGNLAFPNYITEYNFKHITIGNINRNGEATGFHHATSPKDQTTKILSIIDQPNQCGVYRAKVQVKGKLKKAYSTMFPDKYSEQQILDLLSTAYTEGTKNNPTNSTFAVKADECIKVFMVLDSNKKIITSYPIY